MLHRKCLTEFWICLEFWVSQGSEYTSVLNVPGFCICLWFWMYQSVEYIRVLNMLGLHRVLSMPEYFLRMSFTSQKVLWTTLELLRKFENCYAIVKHFLPVAEFFPRFAPFSWQCNFSTLIRSLPWTHPIDPRCSMVETLEI